MVRKKLPSGANSIAARKGSFLQNCDVLIPEEIPEPHSTLLLDWQSNQITPRRETRTRVNSEALTELADTLEAVHLVDDHFFFRVRRKGISRRD